VSIPIEDFTSVFEVQSRQARGEEHSGERINRPPLILIKPASAPYQRLDRTVHICGQNCGHHADRLWIASAMQVD